MVKHPLPLFAAALAGLLGAGCGARSSLLEPEATSEEDACAAEAEPCAKPDACCSGQCTDGLCGPPPCVPGDPPVTLVKTSERMAGLRVDGQFVYFTHYDELGAVRRVPKAGGDVETIVPESNWTETLAADASWLYFLDADRISRVAKGGGGVTVLAAEQKGALAITLSGDTLYWINPSTKGVMRMPTSGGAPAAVVVDPLLSMGEVPTLVVDDAMVYWSSLGIRGAPKQGGAVFTITDEPTVTLTSDAESLYWAQTGLLDFSVDPVVLADAARVVRAGKDGKAAFTLAKNSWDQMGPSIAQDKWSIYFTDPYAGHLNRAPKDSGAKVKLADVEGRPYMLAVDAACVYFVSYELKDGGSAEGTVTRVPRRLPGE